MPLDSKKLFNSLAAAQPPAELVKPCDDPAELKDGSAASVEIAFAHDTDALVTCGARHGAVLDFYRNRDAGLTDAK
jgi:hypothetical protein